MLKLTEQEKEMLIEILDRVAVPGNMVKVYISLRTKILGDE